MKFKVGDPVILKYNSAPTDGYYPGKVYWVVEFVHFKYYPCYIRTSETKNGRSTNVWDSSYFELAEAYAHSKDFNKRIENLIE